MKSKHIDWTLGLICNHRVWPWPWPWSSLDLEFSRSNTEFAISQPKMVRLPQNEKLTYLLNSRAQIWPSDLTLAMTLTLNFQGQIWNLLYLSQKWSYCHEVKSKHIDWTLGLKCDHRVWPWSWPWPWIFKVIIEFPISQPKVVRLPRNEKQTYRLNSRPQMWPMGLTLTITLTIWILKVKCDLDLWPHTWLWSWIFMVKFWNSCVSEWEGRLTLHKGGGSVRHNSRPIVSDGLLWLTDK